MKILKSKQIAIFLVLIGIAFTFTQCKNTTKGAKEDAKNMETKTKDEASKIETDAKSSTAKDKMYFYNKMEHAKVLLDLEEVKAHFILETNEFKAEESLTKAEKHLSNIENSSDNEYNKFLAKAKADIKLARKAYKQMKRMLKKQLII